MLSLKDDEPRFVESSQLSEYTNFEALVEKAGTTDIRAYRFSFASFTAEAKEKSRSGERVILAALGNIENELNLEASSRSGDMTKSNEAYSSWISSYTKKVENNAGLLDVRKDYYDENKDRILEQNASLLNSATRGSGSTTPVNTDMPSITSEISWYSNKPLLVANQFSTDGSTNRERLSGCVPTAGAIALAYYARKKGLPNCWPTTTPDYIDTRIPSDKVTYFKNVVNDLRGILQMTNNGSNSYKLPEAINWVFQINGYGNYFYNQFSSTGKSWDSAGFKRLVDDLGQSWPAFLDYYESMDAEGWHAVTIYKAVVQRDWAGNYKECTYSVALGWLNPEVKELPSWNVNIQTLACMRR